MKNKAIITTIFLLVLTLFPFENISANEIDEVRKPLENYLKNHIKGDSEQLGKSMHSVGRLTYIRDGKYTAVDFPKYLTGWKMRDKEVQAQTSSFIESIEITGNVAVAKLILRYPAVHFTDYMTLHKIDGEWKITNKVAYSVRDPKNNSPEFLNIEDAKVPLENFIRSLETNDVELIKKAFYTQGEVMYLYDKKLNSIPFDKYIADFPKKPAADEAQRKRRIESINITGNVGIGKLVLEYPDVKFTDYMTIMKIGDEWKITNKASNIELPKTEKN